MQNPPSDLHLTCTVSSLSIKDPWQIYGNLSKRWPLSFVWRGRGETAIWLSFGAAFRTASLQSGREALLNLQYHGPAEEVFPRLFGAMAFNPAVTAFTDPLWHGFEPGTWILPQIQLCIRDDRAVLFVIGQDPDAVIVGQLEHDRAAKNFLPVVLRRVEHTTESAWHEQISRIQNEIHSGGLDKAVLARAVSIFSEHPWSESALLRRMTEAAGDEYIFCHRSGGSCFLGQSPERLFRLTGSQIETESLAGTQPAEADDVSGLLCSEKDILEQDFVSRFIRSELSPLCRSDLIEEPRAVKSLSYARHLYTRFSGTLINEKYLDAVIAALHPTPAVCGEPRGAAQELIRLLEPVSRGLYAGAIGWIDSHDAEFAVAIRSALIRDREACLFAGAGIVAESDAMQEWNETALKMSPMLSALGSGPHDAP